MVPMYQAGVAASWGSNLDIVLRLNISPNEKTGVLDSCEHKNLKTDVFLYRKRNENDE